MRRILEVGLAAVLGAVPAMAQGTPAKPDSTKKMPVHSTTTSKKHSTPKTPATTDTTKKHKKPGN